MSVEKTLDDLVDGADDAGRQRIESAMKIAQREWDNISASLEMCGGAGEFCPRDFMIGVIGEDVIIKKPLFCATKSVDTNSPTYYPMYLVKNLLEMDSLMSEQGYRTPQALYCYIELVTKAVSNSGLSGTLAMGFACGYSFCRTGWIAEKGLRREMQFFIETFFETSKKNYEWNFRWQSTQMKMKKIFDKFLAWQKNGALHAEETAEERKVKPLLV